MESLLKDFQVRISQRTATPRRSKKKFDFLRRSHDSAGSGGQSTSGHSTPGTSAGELSPPVSPGNDEEDQSDEKSVCVCLLVCVCVCVCVCVRVRVFVCCCCCFLLFFVCVRVCVYDMHNKVCFFKFLFYYCVLIRDSP